MATDGDISESTSVSAINDEDVGASSDSSISEKILVFNPNAKSTEPLLEPHTENEDGNEGDGEESEKLGTVSEGNEPTKKHRHHRRHRHHHRSRNRKEEHKQGKEESEESESDVQNEKDVMKKNKHHKSNKSEKKAEGKRKGPQKPSSYSVFMIGIDGSDVFGKVHVKHSKRPLLIKILSRFCCCFFGPSEQRWKELSHFFRYSFIPYLMLIQLIYFVVELSMEGFGKLNDNPLFGPTEKSILNTGARESFRIQQNFEIYRLVTPLFMHVGFIPLVIDFFFMLHTCVYFEAKWGRLHFWSIYIFCGIASQVVVGISRSETINAGSACALAAVAGAGCFESLLSLRLTALSTKEILARSLLYIGISFLTSLAPFVEAISILAGFSLGLASSLELFIHRHKVFSLKTRLIISGILFLVSIAGFCIGVFYLFCFMKVGNPYVLSDVYQ